MKPGGTKNRQALSNLGAELAVLKHNTCAGATAVMQCPTASIMQNTTQQTGRTKSLHLACQQNSSSKKAFKLNKIQVAKCVLLRYDWSIHGMTGQYTV